MFPSIFAFWYSRFSFRSFNCFDTDWLNLGPTGPMTRFVISEKNTNANNATNDKIYT